MGNFPLPFSESWVCQSFPSLDRAVRFICFSLIFFVITPFLTPDAFLSSPPDFFTPILFAVCPVFFRSPLYEFFPDVRLSTPRSISRILGPPFEARRGRLNLLVVNEA